MIAFGVPLTSPSPAPSPSPSDDGLGLTDGDIAGWFQNLSEGALELGAVIVVCIGLYLLGRLLIRGVMRSIHKGLPFSRSARRALEQAKIMRPELHTQDQTLELERRRQRAQTIGAVLNSALAIFIGTIVVATVLAWVGIPLGPLIASAGIAGVALGFGAQSLVKDVLSGLFMLLEDQYGVGDVIDVGEATGTVEEFGLRSTRLRSVDGTVWYVPNGEIRRVGNMTRLWSRALIEVRLAYNTDVAKAREAFLEAVDAAKANNPEIEAAILSEPDIPGVESLDYDAVVMRMMLQCTPGTQWAVMRAIRIELRRVLKERGISIALPAGSMYMNAQRNRPVEEPDGAHPREGDDEL